jgi:hypothetical protein
LNIIHLEIKENKMKYAKRAMYLAVLGVAVCSSSSALAWWSNTDHGQAKTDGGTKTVPKQQARDKWSDWFWQGKNEGMQFRCPTNHPTPTCQQRFEINSSRSVSSSKGFSLGATGTYKKQELSGAYQMSWTRTNTTGKSYATTTDVAKGQYAQPIAVQERRWMKGVFHGAHFKTGTRLVGSASSFGKTREWSYDWAWKDFASWTDNRSLGNPYYTVVYKKSGPF